jgi:sortase A
MAGASELTAQKGTCKIIVSVLILAGISFLCAGFWIPAKAILAQHLLQNAWRQSLATGNIIKPWPWADTWPVGRLTNDRLGIDLIVLEGESGEVLAFGPGHLRASSAPGEGGHCMLAGHRDTSFAFLKELQIGDILFLEGKGGKESFLVRTTRVVRAEDLYLEREREGFLTLITCFPFQAVTPNTPDRFIVTATKISDYILTQQRRR